MGIDWTGRPVPKRTHQVGSAGGELSLGLSYTSHLL